MLTETEFRRMCCDWATVDQKAAASPVGASAPQASIRVSRELEIRRRWSFAHYHQVRGAWGGVRAPEAANAERINLAIAAPIKA
jgi:hypothetical protein